MFLLRFSHCDDVITTIAGTGSTTYSGDNGQATAAGLKNPFGVALDAAGNVYIADTYNHRIRKATISTGIITTIAGTGTSSYSGDNGPATSATLNNPSGVALDSAGNIYIADLGNSRIRKVTVSTGIISTIAGTGTVSYSGDNGQATSATLNYPFGVGLDTASNVYIADTSNHRIRKVTISTGIITTFAGTGTASYSGDNGPATSATLNYPSGVAVDSAGNIYIAATENNRIRKVTVSTGIITTIAGSSTSGSYSGDNGPATSATLYNPYGVAVDSAGTQRYF
jgi:sugar lactone lactonase YvrE